ncbi:MAG: MotA/TolQ/ExbB proton channel family protein [Lentisphaerae bacterium]|nr:MotA/TolQ/ExbB proton channel family protein [Lentisphaerota bacterium]
MKRKTKLIIWLVVGIILALGPIWGMIGTVLGMLFALGHLSQPQPQAEVLASNISLALYATAAGWIASPIGIVTIIISAIKLGRSKKETRISNQASQPIAAKRGSG